uniref:Uncharacterized protein n=1 Tax=Cacopsylla melanoneura TaxID=428564 RepID=A0A8D9BNY6_9HEMI
MRFRIHCCSSGLVRVHCSGFQMLLQCTTIITVACDALVLYLRQSKEQLVGTRTTKVCIYKEFYLCQTRMIATRTPFRKYFTTHFLFNLCPNLPLYGTEFYKYSSQ